MHNLNWPRPLKDETPGLENGIDMINLLQKLMSRVLTTKVFKLHTNLSCGWVVQPDLIWFELTMIWQTRQRLHWYHHRQIPCSLEDWAFLLGTVLCTSTYWGRSGVLGQGVTGPFIMYQTTHLFDALTSYCKAVTIPSLPLFCTSCLCNVTDSWITCHIVSPWWFTSNHPFKGSWI